MQPAGDLHNQIDKTLFDIAKNIRHNAATLNAADHMLNLYTVARDNSVYRFRFRRQFFPLKFFHRHQYLCAVRLKSLKTGILQQDAAFGKWTPLNFPGHFLVVTLAGLSAAQIHHAFSGSDNNVLFGMGLLLAAIVGFLLFFLSWTSHAALCSIDYKFQFGTFLQNGVQLFGLPFRQFQFPSQGGLNHRSQPMNPLAGLLLAQPPEKGHRFLNGVKLEIHQNKKHFMPYILQRTLAPAANPALPGRSLKSFPGILFLPFLFKRKYRLLKFRRIQRGDRPHHARIIEDFFDIHFVTHDNL
ncbi:MAG: hypothetical protein PHV34_24190 [Verrucomicrobiae bacterium]|nr:hypothetical protein [Verrucomicrobiae bacterium]